MSIPSTFSNPVVIVIPDTEIPNPQSTTPVGDWGPVTATLYYVPNNTDQAIDIVNGAGGLIAAAVQLKCKIHPRGDATLALPKQQFEVDLHDKPGHGHFLGMDGGGKKWVFNDCGAFDYTLMRNALTFHLQRGMGQYAPEYKFFELFLCQKGASTDDMADILQNYYHGLYLNLDKIKFSHSRVNLPYHKKHLSDDVAILQMNQSSGKYLQLEDLVLTANAEVYEPELKDIDKSTNASAIKTGFNDWYYNSTAAHPDQSWAGFYGHVYNTYILNQQTVSIPASVWTTQAKPTDYLSFATYFILNEIARDPDGYHKSTFMLKDGATCKAGPLWDKNKSYGNVALRGATDPYVSPEGWLYSMTGQSPVWWQVLVYDPKFCQAVFDLWTSNRISVVSPGLLDFSSIDAFITVEVNGILTNGSLARDSARWPNAYNSSNGSFSNDKYSAQVTQMTGYLQKRLQWIQDNLVTLLSKSGWSPPAS